MWPTIILTYFSITVVITIMIMLTLNNNEVNEVTKWNMTMDTIVKNFEISGE